MCVNNNNNKDNKELITAKWKIVNPPDNTSHRCGILWFVMWIQGPKSKNDKGAGGEQYLHGHLGSNQMLKNVEFLNQENGNIEKK